MYQKTVVNCLYYIMACACCSLCMLLWWRVRGFREEAWWAVDFKVVGNHRFSSYIWWPTTLLWNFACHGCPRIVPLTNFISLCCTKGKEQPFHCDYITIYQWIHRFVISGPSQRFTCGVCAHQWRKWWAISDSLCCSRQSLHFAKAIQVAHFPKIYTKGLRDGQLIHSCLAPSIKVKFDIPQNLGQ